MASKLLKREQASRGGALRELTVFLTVLMLFVIGVKYYAGTSLGMVERMQALSIGIPTLSGVCIFALGVYLWRLNR